MSETKVIDSRSVKSDSAIRRRRECNDCGFRFTTYEYVEKIEMMVEKQSGTTEEFELQKIRNGIMIACRKRQITPEHIERLVNEIYNELVSTSDNNGIIRSSLIGELVMQKLKETDEVAYIRFASVYRKFKDVKEFMSELQNIVK